MNITRESVEPTIEEVKSLFDHWRQTRTKREKIPSQLWRQALTLIDRYSISTITS